ncbi:unnamed protein product [Gongylonema pulchrum]|uniref:CW-type domain-containing protein n=1 Tax=Gongylonema pulchrum TaxID=637853 RepID=A0A3P7QQS4_9BILA|nr:unnamed protein product [Gongylonema pulchrum]
MDFYFGLNIHHRDRYGCMVYNNGRLIRMKYLGVVAVVDVPYSVLEPTHNKQSFENKREYMNLLKAINDHMVQYWTDVAIGAMPGGVGAWDATASDEVEFVRKRLISVGLSIQCDMCLKWRHLDYDRSFLTAGIPKDWCCVMHPNALFNYCSKLEELPKIPEGHHYRNSQIFSLCYYRSNPKRKPVKSPSPPAAHQRSLPARRTSARKSYKDPSDSEPESESTPEPIPRSASRRRISAAEPEEDLPRTSQSRVSPS